MINNYEIYINEWPELDELFNIYKEGMINHKILNKNIVIFIVNKIIKYQFFFTDIDFIYKDIEDFYFKFKLIKDENIVSFEIIDIMEKIIYQKYISENEVFICRDNILSWFYEEYKNHEHIILNYKSDIYENFGEFTIDNKNKVGILSYIDICENNEYIKSPQIKNKSVYLCGEKKMQKDTNILSEIRKKIRKIFY